MLTRVGTMAMPCAANEAIVSGCEAAGVLDAVGAGGGQVAQRLLAEAVRRHPGALLVGRRDRLGEHVGRPARREVAGVAVDPVADQLDPAVAGAGLEPHLVDELLGLDLPGEVADVAAGAGDVPAGPHQAGQVVAGLHPPGVGGRAGVAQQQRPGVPVGEGLLLGGRVVDGTVRPEADVAVRVDQAGQHPARHGGDVVVAGGRGIRDAAADHPGLRAHVVGADEDGTGEVQHLSHGPTLAAARAPTPSARRG